MIALLLTLVVQQPTSPRPLDGFETTTTWSARPADGVALTIRMTPSCVKLLYSYE